MAFMALKLLIDNDFIVFDFDYKNNFNLKNKFSKYKSEDTKATFLNIIKDIKNLGTPKLKYFIQDKNLNPNSEDESILYYLDNQRTFELSKYIEELPNNYFEMVLDIYTTKAHFVDYPKEKYKDLYEATISRMKKLTGDLTGQHFTQKSIIHLMCESVMGDLKNSSSDILAIYDPTCGTGSMLMEASFYLKSKIKKEIEVYGQEMHGQTWLLCKIFLEISQIPNSIAYGNTLINPAFHKINGDNSFDFIIANPPFGVDWKHDYDEIISNMKLKEKSNFLVVDDGKKLITPKKSDGQFLFMLHILKLLEVSKASDKDAKASIISSSTLSSTGNERSSESKIRKAIFHTNYLTTLIEQPNAMFTNTDISSHIWFFDNNCKDSYTRLIKTTNDKENLFSTHPQSKDKMKNAYSPKDIKKIISLFTKNKKYITKKIDTSSINEINIQNSIDKKEIINNVSLEELANQLNKQLDEICKVKRFF
jgi:type I restriction enzyme M protein